MSEIPKFSSFKPRKAANENNDGLGESVASKTARLHAPTRRTSSDNTDDSHDRKRRRDNHSREDSHRRHHHRRHRSPSGERIAREVNHHRRQRLPSEERRVARGFNAKDVKGGNVRGDESAFRSSIPSTRHEDGLFIIDKIGDQKNLIYGSIHKYDVPRYWRYGQGSVLGCSQDLKIDRDLSDEKGIVLTGHRDRNHLPAKREKYVFSKGEKHGERLLKLRPDAQGLDTGVEADFVPISSTRTKRKRAEVEDGFLSDDEHQHYRSIEGKAKESADSFDPDFEYVADLPSPDLEDGLIDLDSAIKARSAELSRKVEKQPQDVDTWVELIDHQDKLLGLGKDGLRKATQAEKKSTAEIKIHIYEKAIRLMSPASKQSLERLSIGLMDEGAKVWDIEEQSRRWEDMTKAYPHSVVLWKKFIDFKQTNFASFNYEEHRNLFSTRIGFLRTLVLKGKYNASELAGLCESLIYTLIRATIFMREADHQELALAIWQGVLEYNLFCPPNTPSTSMMDLFRDFWESEVPRIGENRAKGWLAYVRDPSCSSIPDPRSDEDLPEISMRNKDVVFEKWAMSERQRSKESREPARTMDDVTENDPYRVILFDDIEPFLFRLPDDNNSAELTFNAFLAFCQLPQAPTSGQHTFSKLWQEDSFIRSELIDYERTLLEEFLEVPHGEQPKESRICSIFPFHNFANSSDNLFADSKWFKSLRASVSIYGKDSSPVKYDWIQKALQALSTTSANFAEYFLAFESVNDPRTIKKVAKSLLKKYPSSLKLYAAYARIEWNGGNRDAAKNIISSALGMVASMSDDERMESFALRKSLLWAMLEDGNSLEAFQHLLGTPEVSPAAILKTRQELLAARDHSVSTTQYSAAVTQTELLAILEYYTASLGAQVQGEIIAAMAVFDKFSEVLSQRGPSGSIDNELLHQSAARLLYFHANSGPYRPALLREKLTRALALFPQNTLLFSIFAWNESRLPLDKKVRSILLTTIHTPGTVTSHVFAIRHEILHGNVHSQHAAFEKALSGDSETKFNPGLWRLYLLWCLKTNKYENKVKDVFYRGMAACPWAKGFMMLAFEELGGRMGMEELKGVYKVLVEKELRVHVNLDELMEE